jgi:hypothetical protein
MNSRTNRIELAAGVLLLACSSSSGGSGNAAEFIGKWTYSSGSATPMMCSVFGTAIPATPVALTGQQVTINMGVDSSHIQFSASTSCTINFTVSGATATAAVGQMCTFTFDNVPVVVDVSSWTLMLSEDTVMTSFFGSAPIGGASCAASGGGTLSRLATDASAG